MGDQRPTPSASRETKAIQNGVSGYKPGRFLNEGKVFERVNFGSELKIEDIAQLQKNVNFFESIATV